MPALTSDVTAAVHQAGKALLTEYTGGPCTFPQLDVAAGHVDAYWQYECDLAAPGLHQELLSILKEN